MNSKEIIPLIGCILAIITAIIGWWLQFRKIRLEWKEFNEKYTSDEIRVSKWIDDLGSPVEQTNNLHIEEGFPYIAGAPVRQPELFYGHRDLLKEAINCATSPQMASMTVLGAHKSGKTSFLHFLKYSILEHYPQIVPVFLDAHMPWDSCENFYAYMLREILQATEKRSKNIARPPNLPKEVPFKMLDDFIRQASSKRWRFLLLLDGFEKMVKEDVSFNEKFFSPLRSLINLGNVSWVTTSYRFVYLPHTTISPFMNISGQTCYIDSLSLLDAQRLVSEPAARFGNPFDKEDIDFIIKIAGCMPFMIQKASLLLYKLHLDRVYGEEARIQALNSFRSDMDRFFASQISYLEKEEYDVLIEIAKNSNCDCNNPILARLKNYGFIEEVNNKHQILGQTFHDYLDHRIIRHIGYS